VNETDGLKVGQQRILAGGAVLVAFGIGLGAFGAHGLRAVLDSQALGWWQTGVDYQMWNALGLVALGAVPRRIGVAAALIGAGVLVFSGSLYVMALTGVRWLGAVTPVGGLLMIAVVAGGGLAGFSP
jgi:uncharacterized membrane protein YgdD (TMEM256/DUF423 family)